MIRKINISENAISENVSFAFRVASARAIIVVLLRGDLCVVYACWGINAAARASIK